MGTDSDTLTSMINVIGAAAGLMLFGSIIASHSILSPEARKGVSFTFSKIVFPIVIFNGISSTNFHQIDINISIVILISKILMTILMILFGMFVNKSNEKGHSFSFTLMMGAIYAMGATHSFDIGLGVPIAKILFPNYVKYMFINQTIQLMFINPILILLFEFGQNQNSLNSKSSKSSSSRILISTLQQIFQDPVFIASVLGLIVSEYFETKGLPGIFGHICTQMGASGFFLGMFQIGFSTFDMLKLGMNSMNELLFIKSGSFQDFGSIITIASCKVLLMPLLYSNIPHILNINIDEVSLKFLIYLGSLPTLAAVYPLCSSYELTLSKHIIGPLIPISFILSTVLLILSIWPSLMFMKEIIRLIMSVIAIIGALIALKGSRHVDVKKTISKKNKKEKKQKEI